MTIQASDFQNLFNNASISATHAEVIIDQAINLINLYNDADLANLQGTAGSKTVSVESKQKGAIMLVARAVYFGFYKEPSTTTTLGQSLSLSDVMGNPAVIRSVREAARMLVELDVSYG